MIDALIDLPSHLRERLANALKSGLITAPYSASSVRSIIGSIDGVDQVVNALAQLTNLGVSGAAAAVWIQSIERATARIPKPDLVWSGPEVPGVYARDTRL